MTLVNRLNLNRRRALQVAGAGFAVGILPSTGAIAHPDGAALALKRDTLAVAVVQSRADTLTAMRREIEALFQAGDPKDVISFPGLMTFPRNLAEAQRQAIDLQSLEIASLSRVAAGHEVHISFGALVRDAAWPGHVIPMNVLLRPDGAIKTSWHPKRIEAAPFLTTVDAVMDRYVDLYGSDAILPVHKTSVGNLALLHVHGAPDLYQAVAAQGAEIIIQASHGPVSFAQAKACASDNNCYTIVSTPVGDSFLQASGSAIIGPSGEILAEAAQIWTQTVAATLPLAHYRTYQRKFALV